jgi:hypothetical protein
VPVALDTPILVVVVTLLKLALRVTLSAGHCTNRQHSPTLALFEIRDQPVEGHTVGTQMSFMRVRSERPWLTDSQSGSHLRP